jgi:hypothetical protein
MSNITIAAPSTGVINASIRITKNSDIDKNGIVFFLFLKPGAANTRRVIKRFVNDSVELSPANSTLSVAASCAPRPVNRVWEEKGVINVHPDITAVGLLHFSFFITIVFVRNA